jgi:hypothetical protein
MEPLTCVPGGGIVLIDDRTLSQWKDTAPTDELDFAECFSIAVDLDGKTDQIHRWPGESWNTVWRRETQPLVQRMNAGEIAAVVFPEGEFFCDLDVTGPLLISSGSVEMRCRLYVPSGSLVIAEFGKFAEDWEVSFPVAYDSFAQKTLSVVPDWYDVSFSFPANIPAIRAGRLMRFGSPEYPACCVRVIPSQSGHFSRSELLYFRFSD